MRISDIMAQSSGPSVSFEIFPQMTVSGRSIFEVVDELAGLNPSFINVTYAAGGNNRGDLVRLCTHIARLGISPLPHFTVVGHSEREVESILSRYQDYGFENVLALRGDPPRNFVHLFNTTLMGVVKAVSDFYSLSHSTPTVYGASGHAFMMNIHEVLCPSGPYCFNRKPLFALLMNLGIRTTDLGGTGVRAPRPAE